MTEELHTAGADDVSEGCLEEEYAPPVLRKWVRPGVRDLPPLTELTLVSGFLGTPIDGDDNGFP
jgi:hypothetical protein